MSTKESGQILPIEYLHEGNENEKYTVLGIFHEIESVDNIPGQVTQIGTARGAAGFEESGKISDNYINLFQIQRENKTRCCFIPLGKFPIPPDIVAYRQGKHGSYPNQLWFRPPENFLQYFSLPK